MANPKDMIVNFKLERELDKLLSMGGFVKIGVLGDPDQKGRGKSTDAKSEVLADGIVVASDDMTVLDIAVIHEFGLGHVPQRSFIRSTWEKEQKKLGKVFEKALIRDVVKTGKISSGDDIDKRLTKILTFAGAWFAGRVRKTFTNNDWPALKDPSRGGKNFEHSSSFIGPPRKSMPLIDTGQLRASISFQVINDPSNSAKSLGQIF